MSASFSVITTTNNKVDFLKNVGVLYDAYSIHERGEEYKRFTLEEPHCLISNYLTTLEISQQKIVNDVKKNYQRFEMTPNETLHKKLLNL